MGPRGCRSRQAVDAIVRAYMTEVASRYYCRPAPLSEVDQALKDEPYDDLLRLSTESEVSTANSYQSRSTPDPKLERICRAYR